MVGDAALDIRKESDMGSPWWDAGWKYPLPDPHGSSPAAVPEILLGAAPSKSRGKAQAHVQGSHSTVVPK